MKSFNQFLKEESATASFDPEGKFTFHGIAYDQENGLGSVPDNQNVTYKGFAVEMSCKTFLHLAQGGGMHPHDRIKELILSGKPIGSPFLQVDFDEDGKAAHRISGHEGRHRCLALLDIKGPGATILVHVFPRGGLRARHITTEMIAEMRMSVEPEARHIPVIGPHFSNHVWHLGKWITI